MHCFNTTLYNKDFKSYLFCLTEEKHRAVYFWSKHLPLLFPPLKSWKITVSDYILKFPSGNAAQQCLYPTVLNYVKNLLACYWKNTREIHKLGEDGEMGKWGLLKQPKCLWYLHSSSHLDTHRFILILWNSKPSKQLQSCISILHIYRYKSSMRQRMVQEWAARKV